jgi:hypothetical protein
MVKKIGIEYKAVAIIMLVFGFGVIIASISRINGAHSQCTGRSCIDASVFSELPAYPSDFFDKWSLVYMGMISNMSMIQPEYYKQPEFYGYNDFVKEGLNKYIMHTPYSVGGGVYPGDTVLNITRGASVEVYSFSRSDWAIKRYQAFKMVPTYPDKMKIRMGEIEIEQDPEYASTCFGISITPENILLDPTYPKFGYGWAQLVTAKITAMNCTPGWYGIELIRGDPDASVLEKWMLEIGPTMLSNMKVGGSWQIFVRLD